MVLGKSLDNCNNCSYPKTFPLTQRVISEFPVMFLKWVNNRIWAILLCSCLVLQQLRNVSACFSGMERDRFPLPILSAESPRGSLRSLSCRRYVAPTSHSRTRMQTKCPQRDIKQKKEHKCRFLLFIAFLRCLSLFQLQQFKEENLHVGFGSATLALEQAIEKTIANIKWVTENKEHVLRWFAEEIAWENFRSQNKTPFFFVLFFYSSCHAVSDE